MNTQEHANFIERTMMIPPENIEDSWDKGWNAAVKAIVKRLRDDAT